MTFRLGMTTKYAKGREKERGGVSRFFALFVVSIPVPNRAYFGGR